MGLFDFLKRKPRPAPSLQDQLFDAAARGDDAALGALCRDHADAIRDAFPGWQQVPEAMRADPAALQRYGGGLVQVAMAFVSMGDPSLIQRLQGGDRPNPIEEWQRDLSRADELVAGGQAAGAVALLLGTLDRAAKLQGTAVTQLMPMTLGRLGSAHFHAGDLDRARERFSEAIAACEAAGDAEGAEVNRRNLAVVEGESEPGIVFRAADGRTLSGAELRAARGPVRWQITGGVVPDAARAAHQEGRRLGAQGDHASAHAAFDRARALAPTWPYPVYDAAFTWLLQGDPVAALSAYEEVDRLAPRGFFQTKTAVHTLRREAAGDLPAGTWLRALSLEWTAPAERARTLAALAAEAPDFAPILKDRALGTQDPDARLALIEAALDADPDPETAGILRLNRAMTLHARGDRAAALEALGALALDPEATLATEQLAKATLADLLAAGEA